MTDMSDLEWLARNVSEWFPGAMFIERSADSWHWGYSTGKIPQNGYAKDQWQAERQRLGLDAPEWDGELPPVGTRCEIIFHDDTPPKWFEIEFHGIKNGKPFIYAPDTGEGYVAGSDKFDIRPLKSQEQRERERVIEDTEGFLLDNLPGLTTGGRRNIAEKLYDSGRLKKPD